MIAFFFFIGGIARRIHGGWLHIRWAAFVMYALLALAPITLVPVEWYWQLIIAACAVLYWPWGHTWTNTTKLIMRYTVPTVVGAALLLWLTTNPWAIVFALSGVFVTASYYIGNRYLKENVNWDFIDGSMAMSELCAGGAFWATYAETCFLLSRSSSFGLTNML